jgi:hypothetical protein
MHPGKFPLLIILLVTLGICGIALLGRNRRRWSFLATLLIAVLLAVFSMASAYFGVVAITRGSIALAKHGGMPLSFTASGSPVLYALLVGSFFLLAFALGWAAIRVTRLGTGA